MKGYSFLNHARHALAGHKHWSAAWRSPQPKRTYDIVIVGAGGHGLATAYYLAKNHGINNVAVLERGWLGGGNTGRSTQATRSNYFWPQSSAFFDRSLVLYENLSRELNFNIMFSPRGVLTLAHSDHELTAQRRWANAIQINGVDSQVLSREDVAALEPMLNLDSHYPVVGGFIQRRGGISRHDAVAWGYARAASAMGVEIIQECEVTDFLTDGGRLTEVETTMGRIQADKVCIAVAGYTSELARKAGFPVPIESMALQAMVSEPIKPCLNSVVMSPPIHVYVSQSDRGELVIGGAADGYTSYAQRGGIPALEENIAALVELFPAFSRLRLMRQWAGIVDITPDTTPIMGKTPIDNLYISGGWGTGGYKAIPVGGETMAYTIVNDDPHPLIADFGLDRFELGALIDEGAASGVAH